MKTEDHFRTNYQL